MVPDTESTSLKVFSALLKNVFSAVLRVGKGPPAPAAPGRGPGSTCARQHAVAKTIPARHFFPSPAFSNCTNCIRYSFHFCSAESAAMMLCLMVGSSHEMRSSPTTGAAFFVCLNDSGATTVFSLRALSVDRSRAFFGGSYNIHLCAGIVYKNSV